MKKKTLMLSFKYIFNLFFFLFFSFLLFSLSILFVFKLVALLFVCFF